MAKIHINTTQNVELHEESASVMHRVGALMIDFLLYIVVVVAFVWGADIARSANLLDSDALEVLGWAVFILLTLYPLLAEFIMNGQTVGKRIIGIRVACLDGSRPTFSAYLIRWLIGLVEIPLLAGSVAFIAVLLSRNNQRLGDMAAGTTVVKVSQAVSLDQLALSVNDSSETVLYPEARYLTDEDVQVLRDALFAFKNGLAPAAGAAVLHRAVLGVEQKLHITCTSLPEDFLNGVITSYGRIHA